MMYSTFDNLAFCCYDARIRIWNKLIHFYGIIGQMTVHELSIEEYENSFA